MDTPYAVMPTCCFRSLLRRRLLGVFADVGDHQQCDTCKARWVVAPPEDGYPFGRWVRVEAGHVEVETT